MLKIKLARFGKRHQPHYRVIVAEQRSKRDGHYLESLGTYAPTTPGKPLKIDEEKYQSWLEKGAQPTSTVAKLFAKSQAQKSPTAKKEPVVKKYKSQEQKEHRFDKKEVSSTK